MALFNWFRGTTATTPPSETTALLRNGQSVVSVVVPASFGSRMLTAILRRFSFASNPIAQGDIQLSEVTSAASAIPTAKKKKHSRRNGYNQHRNRTPTEHTTPRDFTRTSHNLSKIQEEKSNNPATDWDTLHFHKGANFINIDKKASKKEIHAAIVLKETFDNIRPIEGVEFAILLSACAVALGACSTSEDFAIHFIEGLEEATSDKIPSEYLEKMVEVGIALANFATQFSLTTKSFIHVVCRIRRSYGLPDHDFIRGLSKGEKAILAGVSLTAFSSAKMVFDSWNKKSIPLALVLSSLSWTSSFVVNTNFAYDRLLANRPLRTDLAIIRLLTAVKSDVFELANDAEHPHKFIERLSTGTWFRQLAYRNTFHTSKQEQVESTITQLLELTDTVDPAMFDPRDESWMTMPNLVSVTLGIIASSFNVKAGLQVPNFLSSLFVMGATDLFELLNWQAPDFLRDCVIPEINVDNLLFDLPGQSLETITTAFLSLSLFGVTSGLINTIINTKACFELIRDVRKFAPTFMASGFSTISKHDRMILGSITLPSLGYAIGRGGAMLKYHLINNVIVTRAMAALTLPVFLGISVMSMTGLAATTRNRYEYPALDKALRQDSLLEYYDSLDFTDQMILRRLLLNMFSLSIDAMYTTYNKAPSNVKDKDFFTPELTALLTAKFGKDTGPLVEVKVNANTIDETTPLHAPLSPMSPSSPTIQSPTSSSTANVIRHFAPKRVDHTGYSNNLLLTPNFTAAAVEEEPAESKNHSPKHFQKVTLGPRSHSAGNLAHAQTFLHSNPYGELANLENGEHRVNQRR